MTVFAPILASVRAGGRLFPRKRGKGHSPSLAPRAGEGWGGGDSQRGDEGFGEHARRSSNGCPMQRATRTASGGTASDHVTWLGHISAKRGAHRARGFVPEVNGVHGVDPMRLYLGVSRGVE